LAFPPDPVLGLERRGKSSINRSAVAVGSTCEDGLAGKRAINEANLRAAVSFGSSESSAASCQGSTLSLESADKTVRGISSLSAPTGAYRKSSNSGLKKVTEAAAVTGTTNHIASNGWNRRRCSLLSTPPYTLGT
jgi:hypothetical protein